jgi:hypothetical protein
MRTSAFPFTGVLWSEQLVTESRGAEIEETGDGAQLNQGRQDARIEAK